MNRRHLLRTGAAIAFLSGMWSFKPIAASRCGPGPVACSPRGAGMALGS